MIVIFKDDYTKSIYLNFELWMHPEGTMIACSGESPDSINIRDLVRDIYLCTNYNFKKFADQKNVPIGNSAQAVIDKLNIMFCGDNKNLQDCLSKLCKNKT